MVKTRRARKANVTTEEVPPASEKPEEVDLSGTSQASTLLNGKNDGGDASEVPPAGKKHAEVRSGGTSRSSTLMDDGGGSSIGPSDRYLPDSTAMIVSHFDNLNSKLASLRPILADYFDGEEEFLKAAYILRKNAKERTLQHSSDNSADVGSMLSQN